jgi:hypothetical protein
MGQAVDALVEAVQESFAELCAAAGVEPPADVTIVAQPA